MTPVGELLLSLMDEAVDSAHLPQVLCRQAARDLSARGVAMALLQDAQSLDRTVGSDEATADLEQLQVDLGEGPCLEAHRTGEPVLVSDLRIPDSRWSLYGPELVRRGVRGVHAFPVQVGGIRLGVLDVYREEPGQLDGAEVIRATTYADVAVLILVHLHSVRSGATEGSEDLGLLEDAFSAHPEVHQATGMVAIQAGVTLHDALLLLRARAFVEDRSLHDVAGDVIDRRTRFA